MATKTLFIGVGSTQATGDAFRSAVGNFWIAADHGHLPPTDVKKIEIIYGEQLTTKTAQAPFFNIKQEIEIQGIPSFFLTEKDWKDYITALFPVGTVHTDMVFELESLISKYQETLGGEGALYGDIDFIYNFYVRTYEFILSLPQVSEKILPNIYADISNDADNVDPFFERLITGFGVAPKEEVKMTNLMKNDDVDARDLLYTNISTKIAQTGGEARGLLADRFSNVIFPMENIDMLKDIESHVNIFPMVSKIEFRTDSRTEFAQILKDSNLSTSFLKYLSFLKRPSDPAAIGPVQVAAALANRGGLPTTSAPTTFQTVSGNSSSNATAHGNADIGGAGNLFGSLTITPPEPDVIVESSSLDEIDVLQWWDAFLNQAIDFGESGKSEVFMGNQDASVQIARNIQSSFSRILSLLIFSGKLQSLIKTKMRSYAQITNGEKCYTETVAYRVAKFNVASGTGAPIQNFWFPNSNEIDIIKYFDTQVKFNKEYKYVIYAYELVIGAQYDYKDLQIITDNDPPITVPSPFLEAIDIQFELGAEIIPGIPDFSTAPGADIPAGSSGAPANTEVVVSSGIPAVADPSPYFALAVNGGDSTSPSTFPTPNQSAGTGTGVPAAPPAIPFAAVPLNVDILPNFDVAVPNTIQVRDYEQLKAKVSVSVRPTVKIMERTIYTRSGRVIDSPPVFPDIFIYPIKGIDNKIKINLNTHVGSYLLEPIILDRPGEQVFIDRLRRDKKVPGTSRLWYKTDDPVDHFEIYRMTRLPEKYEDFSNHLHNLLNTDVDPSSLQQASSATYIDDITPNTLYYYMFRSIDRHGKFSNPSPVFSVIMVSNDGIIFPIIKPIQLKPALIPRRPTKTFKKMINIVPTISQSTVDYSRTNLEELATAKNATIMLGVESEGLFGNKFKIRFTSKETGKQIDLNVRFKTERKTTENERK